MVEGIITKSSTDTIYLKYDKEKYNIEYVKNANIILLRRLSDNQIIKVFSDDLGFIIQYNEGEKVNFLVTDYSEKIKNETKQLKFKHYIDKYFMDHLILKNEFYCDYGSVTSCRITDSSYLVEQSGYTGCIYNLREISKRYSRIYNDKKINEYFNDNTLLVSEKIYSSINNDISDNITYGINPETFEITTPIWSELQQRYINVYSQEQIEKVEEKLYYKGVYLNTEDPGRITIYQEIEECLEKIANQFDRPQSIYVDSTQSEINENFVKKFVKNN